MSRSYDVNFMTEEDHETVYQQYAKAPNAAIREAFSPPIEVHAIISIFILLQARALTTPHST
jgi:hypothetical protein